MKTTAHFSPILVLLLALPLWAGAQGTTVWRCGPDGRSYSATPCAEGRAIEVTETRPAADVDAARKIAERERRLADTMQGERLRREAKSANSGLAGFPAHAAAAVKPKAEAPRRPKHRAKATPTEADGTWRATVPVSRPKPG